MKAIYTTHEKQNREYEGIYILDYANSPAVMVECGYITNDKDLAFITDPVNQEIVAKKILEGIVAYSNSSDFEK
ncbi:MAG: N-acetylmuramoyl-L-alanine amidase [Chitinophagaceae bacterium]|nr:N-acetylmuramoyl-L-alanine amidase [Chitinophagaceae bacterium]